MWVGWWVCGRAGIEGAPWALVLLLVVIYFWYYYRYDVTAKDSGARGDEPSTLNRHLLLLCGLETYCRTCTLRDLQNILFSMRAWDILVGTCCFTAWAWDILLARSKAAVKQQYPQGCCMYDSSRHSYCSIYASLDRLWATSASMTPHDLLLLWGMKTYSPTTYPYNDIPLYEALRQQIVTSRNSGVNRELPQNVRAGGGAWCVWGGVWLWSETAGYVRRIRRIWGSSCCRQPHYCRKSAAHYDVAGIERWNTLARTHTHAHRSSQALVCIFP
jgi:hypothetical protein